MNPSSLVTHFSTDALPERDRTAIWREAFGRQIVKAEFDPNPDGRYCYAATFYSLPGLSLATSICEGFRAVRTPRLVAESNEDVILTVNTLGVAEASQLRRETQIGLYKDVLLSAAEIGAIQYTDRARSIVLRLPRQILASVKDLEAAFARRLPQTKISNCGMPPEPPCSPSWPCAPFPKRPTSMSMRANPRLPRSRSTVAARP